MNHFWSNGLGDPAFLKNWILKEAISHGRRQHHLRTLHLLLTDLLLIIIFSLPPSQSKLNKTLPKQNLNNYIEKLSKERTNRDMKKTNAWPCFKLKKIEKNKIKIKTQRTPKLFLAQLRRTRTISAEPGSGKSRTTSALLGSLHSLGSLRTSS